jgi:hypothetical protein
MKKFIQYFVLPIFLIILLSACEKKLFDRRNKYIGDYTFTYSYSYLQGGTVIDTSIFYSGTIVYGSKGEIKVSWYDETMLTLEVDKNGILKKCNKNVGNINNGHIGISFDDYVCEPLLGNSGNIHQLSGDKI